METLSSLFRRSCRAYPSRNVAVTFAPGDTDEKREHLTYQEISAGSSQVAAFFRTLCEGAQAIAVYSKQFSGLIVCLLGVLEAGCHFAPIDITWPPLIACRFLSELNVRYVLVDEQLFGSFQKVLSCWRTLLSTESRFEIVRNETLDSNRFLLVQRSSDSQMNAESLGLAYVMQTSGTTGEPKAVKVPHNCIVPNITDLREIFQVTVDDVVFVASPYTFDPFIVQVFVALTAGARLVLVPDDTKMVPSLLCHCLFDRERVTIFQPTPSLMYYLGPDLIRSKILCAESSVRILAFGGECCPSLTTLRQWRPKGSKTQLYNLYGITEVSCWASCYHIPENQFVAEEAESEVGETNGQTSLAVSFSVADMKNEVPLGTPLLDTIVELRGEDGKVVEQGMGQIYIGGSKRVCLLGNERSLSPGTLRATGDWVYVKDRIMWYCGRRDRQVKRMGKRINLDWLEHQISETILGSTCCLVLEQTVSNNPCYRLHLFVVKAFGCRDKENLDFLGRSMRNSLPVFAQPDCIHVVSHLPMTAHGKVNRQALLGGVKGTTKPGTSDSVRNFLMRAWSNVLEVNEDNVGNDANFSDKALFIGCGGSSFAAVRLAESIESWVTTKTNAVLDLSGSLEVILNKPFGSLCSYVESKLKLSTETDVAENVTIDQQWKDSTFEETKRTGIVSDNLEEVSPTAAPLCQQQNMHASHGDHVKLEDDKNNVSTVIQGKASLENNEPNPRTSPMKQAAELSVKRKRLFSNSDQQEGFPARPRKTKVQFSMSEDDFSDTTKLVSGFENCYCSVRRGMQWKICKFCKISKAGNTACLAPCIDRCHKPVASSEGVGSQTVASLEPNNQLINHISIKKKASLTTGSNILSANSKNGQNVETCDLNLRRNVFINYKWRTNLYRCIDASPLVVFSPRRSDGEVFIGSHGHVFMCVRLSDGEVLWERRVGDRIESSAVLSNEGIYVIVGCYDGRVYVFDRDTGAVVWTFQTGAAVKSSPCVDPQTALAWIGSHDHHLYALDVTNKLCVCALDCGDGSCFSSPCVSREPHLVFIATLTGRLLAVHATEYTVLWSQQCPKPAFASPVVLPVGVACACVDGFIYSFDFQGKKLWQFQTEGSIFCSLSYKDVESGGIACGRVVFGSHDRCVYCLSLDGELKWSFTTDGQVYATPFITELNASPSTSCHASCFHESDASDVQMAVFAFSTTGTLYVLEFLSGRLLGSYLLPGEVFSSPVVVDNRVLIGCRDDFLYSLEVSISSQQSEPVPQGPIGCCRTDAKTAEEQRRE